MAPVISEEWASATLKGKPDGTNNATAMVYSNIEAAEEVLFAVEYKPGQRWPLHDRAADGGVYRFGLR